MKFRELHPNIRIRLIVSFFTQVVSNMVLPLMSVYFAQKIGTSKAGLMMTASVLAGLAIGLFGGYYSDRFGRKRLMVLSEALMVLVFAGMAAANSPWFTSVYLTFAMLVLHSICWGLYGPAAEAMILDVSSPESRKAIYGLMYWLNNLSFAIGGLIGSILFERHLFMLLVAMVCIATVSLFITWRYIGETLPTAAEMPGEEAGERTEIRSLRDIPLNYWMVLKDRTFMIYVLASLLVVSVEFHLGNYIGVRLEQEMNGRPVELLGQSIGEMDGIRMLGILRTENTVMVVLLAAVAAKWLSRFPDNKVLQLGFLCYTAGFAFMGYSNTPLVLIAAMALATFGEVTYVPVKQAFLGALAPKEARSSYMAVNGLVFRGAMTVGSLGIILGGVLPSWTMAVLIAGSGLCGMLLFALIMSGLTDRQAQAE